MAMKTDDSNPLQMLAIAIVLASLVLSASVYFSADLLSRTIEQKPFTVSLPPMNIQPVLNITTLGGAAPSYPSAAPVQAPSAAPGCGVQAPSAPSGCGAVAPGGSGTGGTVKAAVNVSGLPPKGSAKARVTVVIFSDYLCPFCKRAESTNAQLLSQYDGKINLVHMNLVIHGQPAHVMAEAAECAGAQGKFWEMHDAIFADQKSDAASLKAKAAAIAGIDTAKFNTCLDSGAMASRVDAQNAAAGAIGAGGTPTFVIGVRNGDMVNGQMVVGAQDIGVFQQAVNTALNS
ncbi:Thioredoxin [uncultured archaeon]|nr:Thioredoxin [uncultured archaeon]